VELDYDALLLGRDLASLQIWSQVVNPPEPAALATPLQTCSTKRPKGEWRISDKQLQPPMSTDRCRSIY